MSRRAFPSGSECWKWRSNSGDDVKRRASASADLHGEGDVFEDGDVGIAECDVGGKVFGGAGVDAGCVDSHRVNATLSCEPLRRLGAEPGEMQRGYALGPPCGGARVASAIGSVAGEACVEQNDAAAGNGAVEAFPGLEVADAHQVVAVGRGLRAHVDPHTGPHEPVDGDSVYVPTTLE